ncbi:hypothetical protein [Sphingomonas sp.]|uniref:hypothetical protein n=1 Tax=Sphingomonas sp. TaxID=28214 RepID=UPI0025EBCF2B|nr:hypothetical protein [Sphingomonas sp.]
MHAISNAGMALAMIAAFLLGGVGVRLALKGDPGTRQRGLLMVAAALVLIANVLIWTL